MKTDSRKKALKLMDALGVDAQPEQHAAMALRNNGWIWWEKRCVLIAIPYDPVDGEHKKTAFVLYGGGSPLALAEKCREMEASGIEHICYSWQIKRGSNRLNKVKISRWCRLVETLNKK